MIYREFQGIKLSGLGLGMMRLPVIEGKDNEIDEKKTEEMIDYAYNNGINYFDTAWGYHGGQSELIAGKCLTKYPRESYYLATKFPGYDNSNMPKVKEIFEKQLEKCQTDYFDFYLIHNVYEGNVEDYINPKFGILDYLLEQKKNGRIRHFGFSVHGSLEVMEQFLKVYGEHMEFCQVELNYMDWHFQKADLKVALLQKMNIPIWVMEPLRGGKLAKVPADIEKELKAMRPNETVPAWAFRFLQTIPGVTVVLSGMSNMEQLKQNIDTWKEDKPLSDKEFNRIVELMDIETSKGGLPCTSCHYCMSYCPQALPIPEIIGYYNEQKLMGGFLGKMAVRGMPEEKQPSSCITCRSCEAVCPQQIKIADMMTDFTTILSE